MVLSQQIPVLAAEVAAEVGPRLTWEHSVSGWFTATGGRERLSFRNSTRARPSLPGWGAQVRCQPKLSGARRGEEFQLDVVRVAEDQHRSVVLVGNG